MASRKENLKALFTNTRSRVIIVFTMLLLLLAVIIGIVKLTAASNESSLADANVPNTPNIQSIPGALDPTAEYAKLQETQNVNQAEQAIQSGGSAIPTIVRSQLLGNGTQSVGAQDGQGGVGFSTLELEKTAGSQRKLWIQEIQSNNCSKTVLDKVKAEGAKLADIKAACSCTNLKEDGYSLAELQTICSCKELKAAGITAQQLKGIGYTASQLRQCGYSACAVRSAGFTLQEMKNAGFSDGELKGAGFTDDDILHAGGLPANITAADLRKAGCNADSLKNMREAGVSAAVIRQINGCNAAQLKAAGYTARDLNNAGFTAADLKKAGFDAAALKQAGYTARDLLNAGFTPNDLTNAGYTPNDIMAAEAELPPGITADDVKNAGCDIKSLTDERIAGVSAKLIKQNAGCSAEALKEAGFTANDLANAGFTPAEIADPGKISDQAIRALGCDAQQLKTLQAEGVSALRIHELNGCSANALKAAGYGLTDLTNSGFTPAELAAAGFSPNDIKTAADNLNKEIKAAGCNSEKLKNLFNQNVAAQKIQALNHCSAAALKAAGYNRLSLLKAGFTPADLAAAGFAPPELNKAESGPAAILAAGRINDCSTASLKAAYSMQISASSIRQVLGCSAQALRAAGYSAAALKKAGFTAAELKNAGFDAAALKTAGFTGKELKDAGFSAAQLKNAGFNAQELAAAGFNAKDLKDAGFSANELKAAGFNAQELAAAGFNAKDLKDAGFSAGELKAAGYNAKDLAEAGYNAEDLKKAGFSQQELAAAGLTNSGLANLADYTPATNTSTLPAAPTGQPAISNNTNNNAEQLQKILAKQNQQMADQRYQQKIQQRTADMLSAANQSKQFWKNVSTQVYTAGAATTEKNTSDNGTAVSQNQSNNNPNQSGNGKQRALVKSGDIVFAVLDTSVNSDEPGPILATIVSGKFKGAKLIGSFNLPSNADKMVIAFNTMSVPGANGSTAISAIAIDPNTARTALASSANHHYLSRYGSLFASSFLQGFGSAFQSEGTTITIGGTDGTGNNGYTFQNSASRSALENAVIGLANVGQNWGQIAQQQFNQPITVKLFSGTGMGILFTQDLTSL